MKYRFKLRLIIFKNEPTLKRLYGITNTRTYKALVRYINIINDAEYSIHLTANK